MKLSVVILSYNVRYFLELCIKSVQAAIADLDAEVIVVDNHSSDASCQMVKTLFPEITLIENKQNLGFSKGNNIGVTQANGEYICLLNPDTVVAEDTFKKTLAFAEVIPKMGILGCQLIDGRGQFLPESKRNIPTPIISIKKVLGFSSGYYAKHVSPSDIGEVDVLVGAFMILKKTVYQHVKGFDEDYFMYGEDIDLSYKVLKAGFQNFYFGEASIIHYKGESTLKDKTYAKRFYGAMQIFYNKHFKSNWAFDMMVWFGIRGSRLVLKTPKKVDKKTSGRILLSEHLDVNIKFPFKFEMAENLKTVAVNSQVIFDGNTMSYKQIIDDMISSDKKKFLTFRILPKNAQFIIGSDSSQQQGEVIVLPKLQ
ncbi:GT2 family glycosyltransferase [Gelidibacter algens]|uniref:GT2 family glycosyltransferase n=1 Tax=Gelidibacter algens TaxID=49280 RepID=A0A1A7R731_9FLAO|nr:glycosyltransferase family 2 protein [Gelidibacter algens]OBX27279.1 glycosyl transferase family 2 [Gelidibacter algens]RAJ20926.1 GT2 family glycosyltransferase [Gelidibacter algens]